LDVPTPVGTLPAAQSSSAWGWRPGDCLDESFRVVGGGSQGRNLGLDRVELFFAEAKNEFGGDVVDWSLGHVGAASADGASATAERCSISRRYARAM
jgi:hypothetical protein